MQNRARFNQAFDLDIDTHKGAYRVLMEHPNRHRSELVIQAILSYANTRNIKHEVIEAVREALQGMRIEDVSQGDAPASSEREDGQEQNEKPLMENAISFLSGL